MSDYIFKFTDLNVAQITVPAYHVDGPLTPITVTPVDHSSNQTHYPATATSPSTTLTLVGKGVAEYGKIVQQNMIYMLENFSSSVAPVKPLVGQLWYDNDTDVLNVYTSDSVWDTVINASGGTITGPLVLDAPITLPEQVVNKAYVDTKFANVVAASATGQLICNYNATTGVLLTQIGDITNSATAYIPTVSNIEITTQYEQSTRTLTISLSSGTTSTVQIPADDVVRTHTISTGSALFNVPVYTIGSNRLWIFANGIKQMIGVDYVETNNTTITFSSTVPAGVQLEFLHI